MSAIVSTLSARALGALAMTAAGVVVVVGAGPGARPAVVASALVASGAGFAWLMATLSSSGGLPLRLILGAGFALTALCVALPPAGSKDVASYAAYGRMLTEYRENPYTSVPADHPDDPWYPDVSTRWRNTRSVYGPVFTVVSAVITGTAGGNRLAVRLGFQALAGVALLAAAVAVARLTADPAATAFVALNPVLLASVVNGGHNDALVGAALLGACVAARRRWWVTAGAFLALGAGVKVAAVLALPALVAWVWTRHGLRAAAVMTATAAAVLGFAHLVFGPMAIARALAEAGTQHSRSSVFRLAFAAGPDRLVGLAAVTASVAVGAVLARRHLGDPGPEAVVASALVGYLLLGPYVLPWYHAWVLLPVAVVWRSRVALGAAAGSAILLLGYVWQPGDHGPVAGVLRSVSYWGAPAFALAIAAALLASVGSSTALSDT